MNYVVKPGAYEEKLAVNPVVHADKFSPAISAPARAKGFGLVMTGAPSENRDGIRDKYSAVLHVIPSRPARRLGLHKLSQSVAN